MCMNARLVRWCTAWLSIAGLWLASPASAFVTATILAGGETALPADTPSGRLDTEGDFSFVGALEISNGTSSYKGSAVALSPDWVITAGHNADLNDDGLPDAGWSATLHLTLLRRPYSGRAAFDPMPGGGVRLFKTLHGMVLQRERIDEML